MRLRRLKILWCILALVTVERFCYVQTAGFRLGKVRSDFVYEPRYPQDQTPKSDILTQPFTFLGSGVQSYAFLSRDGTTVLKLFKHYHNLPIEGFLKEMPLPPLLHQWRAHLVAKREKRLESIFSSCEIACHECREETGTLFLHLQPTNSLKQTLTLIDKLGIAHQIDLDKTAFVLQRKVEMLSKKMENLRKNQDHEGIRASLASLVKLIDERGKKGVANTDLRLERNIGFIGLQALEIDLGSFHKIGAQESGRALKRERHKVKQFIKKHYPEYVEKKAL